MFKMIKKMFVAGIGAVEFARESVSDAREFIMDSFDEFVERGERLTEHEDSYIRAFMAALKLRTRVPSSEEVDIIIPGYDDMTVTEVLDQLKPLSMRDLELIRAYEHHNLNRIRIIRQVDRELDEARIIAGYDELPVGDIVDKLEDLSEQELASIKDYEKSHRKRVTILRAIDQRLKKAA